MADDSTYLRTMLKDYGVNPDEWTDEFAATIWEAYDDLMKSGNSIGEALIKVVQLCPPPIFHAQDDYRILREVLNEIVTRYGFHYMRYSDNGVMFVQLVNAPPEHYAGDVLGRFDSRADGYRFMIEEIVRRASKVAPPPETGHTSE